MVEKLTFNSRATALVDIPAVNMSIARSLKICDICGIVLCDKTAHFRVAFYCGQPKGLSILLFFTRTLAFVHSRTRSLAKYTSFDSYTYTDACALRQIAIPLLA